MKKMIGIILIIAMSMALCACGADDAIAQRSDACVTSYWVLPDAEIGRIGSKAAFLP